MGLEPTIFRLKVWRVNQLLYRNICRVDGARTRKNQIESLGAYSEFAYHTKLLDTKKEDN